MQHLTLSTALAVVERNRRSNGHYTPLDGPRLTAINAVVRADQAGQVTRTDIVDRLTAIAAQEPAR